MLAAAVGIAVSGVILRFRDDPAFAFSRGRTRQLAQLLLFVLAMTSVWLRVRIPIRGEESSSSKANRFVAIRTASAISAALAVPLGLAYSWAVEPDLAAVAPFWAVAIGFSLFAIPRSHQVESLGLDGPDT